MSQSFYGAQPKVVKNKTKYNTNSGSQIATNEGLKLSGYDAATGPLEDDDGVPFNIMYDKRVFRGNTYNLSLMK